MANTSVSDKVYNISNFYQSFSGTDTLAFIIFPGCVPIVLGSLTTISYSMYRNKKPVINIGRININGVTRGSRIFAGTMIFTLINQHWLKEVQELSNPSIWLKPYKELKVDELPLFDIMITSANEYGNYVSMFIYGIDITDEAQTVSVEDMFTENTFSFVARDISVFKKGNVYKKNSIYSGSSDNDADRSTQRLYVIDSSAATLDDISKLEREFTKSKINSSSSPKTYKPYDTLSRKLYESTSNTMIGNDVAYVQEMLNKVLDEDQRIPVTGVFDHETDIAVREYQKKLGLDTVDGVVNTKLYNNLLNDTNKSNPTGIVVNKDGAYLYEAPSFDSRIVDTKPYQETVSISELVSGHDDDGSMFYKTDSGYALADDIYSSVYSMDNIDKDEFKFPDIKDEDQSSYVTMIQSMLLKIYPDCGISIDGIYSDKTKNKIIEFQKENGLEETGIVNRDTWLELISKSSGAPKFDSDFSIDNAKPPGEYTYEAKKLFDTIELFTSTVSSKTTINTKSSLIITPTDGNGDIRAYDFTKEVKDDTTFCLNDFGKRLLDEPSDAKRIKKIEYVIYPFNKKPYKWIINVKESKGWAEDE